MACSGDDRRLAAVLVPAPVLFLLFMGTQERFFGRWLLPVFPIVCLLAACGALRAVGLGRRGGCRRCARRSSRSARSLLLGQGVVYAVHHGIGAARGADTRNMTRAWLVENVPPETKIVVEPVVPDGWAQDIGRPVPLTSQRRPLGQVPDEPLEHRQRRLAMPGGRGASSTSRTTSARCYPELIDRYEREGYCWVVVGSTQRGRAEAEPEEVPRAIAYYRELERRARRRLRASPYRDGAEPGAVQLRLVVRLLPDGLRAARARS